MTTGVGSAVRVLLAVAAVGALALALSSDDRLASRASAGPVPEATAGAHPQRTAPPPRSRQGRARVPSAAALDRAGDYARSRSGVVAFATVGTDGRLRGYRAHRPFASASVVKAMLLAAEIRRLKQTGEDVDEQTDALLRAMITVSDNGAADAIYARVGDAGLLGVARRAGMTRFDVDGHWGNARITAADMALMFGDLDRVLAQRHRAYAKQLLASIHETQRWGIAAAIGERWKVRFKGGWLPARALVHQAADLRSRNGKRRLAIVVLTDEQPSFDYGIESVREVAERLFSRRPGGA